MSADLDIIENDDAATEESDISFGKEIGKTLVKTTAQTAGAMAILLLVGFTASKIQDFRAKRAASKTEETVHTITDAPIQEPVNA